MSHDLEVYGRTTLAPDDLATGRCTVNGPSAVEAEDVPEEVTAVMLGAAVLWRVHAPLEATEIRRATRIARALARSSDGVVLDLQTGGVSGRSTTRHVRRPTARSRVDVLELEWCVRTTQLPATAADDWLACARRWLPEALPRRFGTTEPLRARLDVDGPEEFAREWLVAEGLSFRGTGPVAEGHLDAPPEALRPGEVRRSPARSVWTARLRVLADLVDEPAWWHALRGLLTSYAQATGAFHASAELTSGHIWSNSLWSDRETERVASPVVFGEWHGLPPTPRAWQWLGSEYGTVASALPDDLVTPGSGGVLFAADPDPRVRAGASGSLRAHLPGDLFARIDPDSERWEPVPLLPAPRILGPRG